MTHIELHNKLSKWLTDAEQGKLKPQNLKEQVNAAGKLINLCKLQLEAVQMGADLSIPLLGINKGENEWIRLGTTSGKVKQLRG